MQKIIEAKKENERHTLNQGQYTLFGPGGLELGFGARVTAPGAYEVPQQWTNLVQDPTEVG
jgi:hypothetical protein